MLIDFGIEEIEIYFQYRKDLGTVDWLDMSVYTFLRSFFGQIALVQAYKIENAVRKICVEPLHNFVTQ
jgi:hypothetical protein